MNLESKDVDISPEQAIEELEDTYNVYLLDKKKKNKFIRTVTLNNLNS